MTDADLNDANWSRFRGQLARRLVTLKRDEFVEIHGASQRSHTTLVFTLTGSGRIRCAVDGMALGPFWPPADASIGRAQVTALDRLGWRQLRSGEYIRESGKRSLGELVSAAADALRQVWSVADPSSLTIHDPFGPDARAAVAAQPKKREVTIEGKAAVGLLPEDAKHLLQLVRTTMEAYLGDSLEMVGKAICFNTADADLYSKCLVSPYALRIEFCTIVGHGTLDMDLLGAVVAEHSSRWPDISLVVIKDHVFAVRPLECSSFHVNNLMAALKAWDEFCSEGAIDIIEQLHPESAGHYDPPAGQFPRLLAELLAEFATNPVTLTAAELVNRTRANTPLLRRYARMCTSTLEDSTVAIDTDGELRRAEIEKFMPVLVAATSLAAQHNVAWEMPRGA
uniref:TY-Chap domain-containing protein n=1 Tax=Gordonia sp. B7-2 TaxID=3420932 RepID=UPI003D8B3566